MGRPIPMLVLLAWPALAASPLAAQQGVESRRLLRQGVTYPGLTHEIAMVGQSAQKIRG